MLGKKLSILTVKSLSRVSFSPLLFHSSIKTSPLIHHDPQNPPGYGNGGQNSNGFPDKSLDFDKRSNLDHGSQLNSNGFSEKSLDFDKRSNFGGVNQLIANRDYGGSFDGYQKNSVRDVSRLNLNGFYGENSRVRRSNYNGLYGENRYVQQRNNPQNPQGLNDGGQNPNGLFKSSSDSYKSRNFEHLNQMNSRGNLDGYQRNNIGQVSQLDSSVHQRSSYEEINRWSSNAFSSGNQHRRQRNNIGEIQQLTLNGLYSDARQLNPNGFNVGIPNGHQSEIQQSHHSENYRNFYQNSNVGYDSFRTEERPQNESGMYREGQNEFSRENPYQKGAVVIQRPNFNSDGFNMQSPQNANSFYGDNSVDKGEFREFRRNSNEHFGVNSLPIDQQNYGQLPFVDGTVNNGELPATCESIGYKGTLVELDECCKNSKVKEAIEVLELLKKNSVAVDLPRYMTLLEVCTEDKALEEARIIHDHIYQAMGDVGIAVNNKLLDLYAKCGSMADAYQLFEQMPQRNLTSWDVMIAGLVNNNLGEEAIDLFTQFKEMGLKPDGGLFISVFNACGVLGAVDEGMLHFESMKADFGIAPTMEHYVSIVDMMGKSGYLDEALEYIEKMPVEPSIDVWETLMNFCNINGYKELGKRCVEIVTQLDSSRLTEEAKMGFLPVKASDKEKRRKNNSNTLDFKHRVHELRAGDRSHPMNDLIYEQLRNLVPNMKAVGYVPNIKYALHDVGEESREEAVLAHSEKLAAAYALLTTPARSPIRIIKNLRFCGDCHDAMKIISKLTGRLIISRDAKRFHHFQNGVCSCRDYY